MRATYPRRYQDSFNRRELEILGLIRHGFSNEAIALQLSLSVGTVKWYNRQIFSKLGVESRTQAIEKAIQIGLIDALQRTRQATWLSLRVRTKPTSPRR